MILSHLQTAANNVYKISIWQNSNKILYSFKLSEVIDLLQKHFITASLTLTVSFTAILSAIEAYSVEIITECLHSLPQLNEQTISVNEINELQSTQWTSLWDICHKNFLITITTYWLSLIDAQNAIAWVAIQAKHYYDVN